MISSINQRNGDLSIFARGGVTGIAAAFASSVLSPFTLIPVGGVLKFAEAGEAASVALRAGEMAALSGAAGAAQTAVNQATGGRESWGQIGLDIGLDTVMGGILGAAATGLSRGVLEGPLDQP